MKFECLSRSSRRAAPTGSTGITNAALCWKVGSLRSNGKARARASEDVLCGGGQGHAVTACAECALPLEKKTSLLA